MKLTARNIKVIKTRIANVDMLHLLDPIRYAQFND